MKRLMNYSQYITESMDTENELETQAGKSEYVGKRHKITDVQDIKNFIFAGKSIFTIESSQTGVWYTYKVSKLKDKERENTKLYFVAVLRGPDNINSYTYIGKIWDGVFSLTKGSKFKEDATCVKAFKFFFTNIMKNFIDPRLNFYHMGICGRCGRALTVPESITRGIGPVCANLSEEERINLDRKNKLVGMQKSWKQDDVIAKRKETARRNKYGNIVDKYPGFGNRQDDGDTSDEGVDEVTQKVSRKTGL